MPCSQDREVSPVEQSLKATSARYSVYNLLAVGQRPVIRQILFSCVSSIAQTAMEITTTVWWISCFRVSLSSLKVPAPRASAGKNSIGMRHKTVTVAFVSRAEIHSARCVYTYSPMSGKFFYNH